MSTPPEQPGDAKANKTKASLQKHLDELLLEIETVEPGAVDPASLPQQAKPAVPPSSAVEATPSADAEIDSLLNAPPTVTHPEPNADVEIEALLNAPPADEVVTPAPLVESAEAIEDKLQEEITALIDAEPQDAETPPTQAAVQTTGDVEYDEFDGLEGSFESPESLAVPIQTPRSSFEPTTTTQDLIAQEIEGLLNTETDEPATAAAADTAIDELDKMLAQEIDTDDDLAGDFQSVEDLTAGIQVPDAVHSATDDEHAATARDVAAELDSQPEDLPDASFEPVAAIESDEDPFAVLDQLAATAEKNEQEHQQRAARQAPDYAHWLEIAREKLLSTCYLINWPARRFLNNEWRATLGLISLTFACTSSIFLLFVLILG